MANTEIEIKLKKHCIIIYILYALSAVLQFSSTTLMIGIITLFLATLFNNNKKKIALAKETIFESHLRWAKRTFWIGTFIYFPISIIIATIIVFNFTNIVPSIQNENIINIMLGIQHYMEANLTKVTLLAMIPTMPVVIWWLWRLWTGYKLIKNNEEIKNVTRWI